MEKAYDLKDLGKRLKEKGVVEAEDMAGAAYLEIKEWLKDSAALSKTPYDDMAIPFLGQVDTIVLPQIDKIDGQVG